MAGGDKGRLARVAALLRASRDERRRDPVFVVGAPRSGTSLLLRLLQHVGRLRPRQVDVSESQLLQALAEPSLRRGDKPSLEHFLLGDEHEVARFFALAEAIEPWRRLTAPLQRPSRRLPLLWVLRGNRLLTRAYIGAARTARGCERVVEKTPQNAPWARHLELAYPRAKMVYLSRHPVDTLTSYWRRADVDPGSTWARIEIDDFVRVWRHHYEHAARFEQANPERLRIVRYEDLAERPTETMEALCAFLGEPFTPDSLPTSDEYVGAFPPDPHLFGRVVAKTKDWRDHIDVATAQRVEDLLAEPMAAAGYRRYT